MASITTEARNELIALFVGMFNGAPGADQLSEAVTMKESGKSLLEVANSLAAKANFTKVYPAFLTSDEFAAKLVGNLLPASTSATAVTWSTNWVKGQLTAGKSAAAVITAAVQALRATTNTDFSDAKAQLGNKVDVASYYSVDKNLSDANLANLQQVIVNVSATATTVTTAKTAVDNIADNVIGQKFDLSINVDTVNAGAGNDVINAGYDTATKNHTLSGLDSIDGGAGKDTLNITDSSGNLINVSLVSSVKNVETINITSVTGLESGKADISGWTGATAANFQLIGIGADQTITAPSTAALSLVGIVSTAANVALNGGTSVTSTLNNTVDNSGKTITVTGDAGTASVSVKQTAATATNMAAVTILDKNNASATTANTIKTVSIDGLKGAVAIVKSNALETLNIANSTKDVTVTNSTASHALALNLNTVTGGVITDATAATLNVNTTGKSSGITISGAAVKTLNFDGSASLAITTLTAAAATAVTVKGAGGLTVDVSGITTLTSFDASASTGANTVTIDGTKSTFTGGTGVDTVTLAAAPTKAIAGGDGTDVIVVNAASFSLAKVSGFETLAFGAGATGAYDATGFTGLQVPGTVTGAITANNVAAGTTLALLAAPGQDFNYVLKDATGTSDSVAITLAKSTSTGIDFSAKNVDVSGIETVTVSSLGDGSALNKVTLVDTAAKSLTLTGVATTVTLAGATKLATVDASALTEKTAGTLTLDLSGIAVASTGSTITGSATVKNTILGGAGTDIIKGGALADTITSGAGLDMLTGNGGNDTFVLARNVNGNTYATITDANKGDILQFVDKGTETFTTTKIALADTAAFQDFLDAAAAGDGSTNAAIKWFQYGGNTYVVEDTNAASTFQNDATTGDLVVKLTGLVDLATATGAGTHIITIG